MYFFTFHDCKSAQSVILNPRPRQTWSNKFTTKAENRSKTYSVMVTPRILIPLFQVRVLVGLFSEFINPQLSLATWVFYFLRGMTLASSYVSFKNGQKNTVRNCGNNGQTVAASFRTWPISSADIPQSWQQGFDSMFIRDCKKDYLLLANFFN